jgi:hypothetical protein
MVTKGIGEPQNFMATASKLLRQKTHAHRPKSKPWQINFLVSPH